MTPSASNDENRSGGIVVAVLSLVAIPFGTVFGVYALWVLFSPDAERLFTPPSTAS